MKTLFLWMLVFTIASVSNAQNVDIPDTAFLNALIDEWVDRNGDGEISKDEAEVISFLDFSYKDISDMTGIEAFISINTLYCNNNQLTSQDVSNNTALEEL